MSNGTSTSSGELVGKSAIELAGLVHRREVSPVEIVRAYLERINRLEPTIAAFQVVRAEKALEEARALEGRDDLGELPLAGLPAMSVPAGLSTQGLPLAVQLVGHPGAEGTLLALAKQIEEPQPWPRWKESVKLERGETVSS